ncbi:MAG: TetR/AcrR family transcriptional regulator, partial [Candidatus Thiodiazotropha sp.]
MPHLKKITPANAPVDCRILSTALDLFVERGFHNVSIHDIQKQANVSIGSIYNHFGGKEGVAKALFYHLIREMEELVEDVI